MSSVWIVQPYVPAYRVGFFESLSKSLESDGIKLNVVAGKPRSDQLERGDDASPSWLYRARDRGVRAFGRTITLTSTRACWRNATAVVVPHMGSSLDALSALSTRSRLRVGVWGHIAPYVAAPHPIDSMVERWQLRRADHVFAYTPGGADFAARVGVDPRRVTAVMNSVDTDELSDHLASLDDQQLEVFRRERGIPNGPVLCFLGGLDESKRVSLLAQALDVLYAKRSNVHILVAGSGAQSHMLSIAAARHQVTLLGHQSGRSKASILALSRAIVCPGRVGLVAVDALVAGLPVVTTQWPYHAPEIEYLQEGSSRITASDDPQEYAAVLEWVAEREKPTVNWDYPTLSGMVANFGRGIRIMLEERPVAR